MIAVRGIPARLRYIAAVQGGPTLRFASQQGKCSGGAIETDLTSTDPHPPLCYTLLKVARFLSFDSLSLSLSLSFSLTLLYGMVDASGNFFLPTQAAYSDCGRANPKRSIDFQQQERASGWVELVSWMGGLGCLFSSIKRPILLQCTILFSKDYLCE